MVSVSDPEDLLDSSREAVEMNYTKLEKIVEEDLSDYQHKFARRGGINCFKLARNQLLVADADHDPTLFGEAAAYFRCRLQGIVAFWRGGEGSARETAWYKFLPSAEMALWLGVMSGDPSQQRQIAGIVREFTPQDGECTYHRIRSLLSTIEGDEASARTHIEWLERNAESKTYREGYLDDHPLTTPLLDVYEAILDENVEQFQDALGSYLTEALRENRGGDLPIESPGTYYLPIPVVGMLALAKRQGLATETIDIEVPESVASSGVNLVPREILVHDWPSIDHEPSESVRRLWEMIDSYEYPVDGASGSDSEKQEDRSAFESVSIVRYQLTGSLSDPDLHAFGNEVPGTREQVSEPYGQWLASAIDDQLHVSDQSPPSFAAPLNPNVLERAIGPLTSASEDLYLVVTERAIGLLSEFDPDAFGLVLAQTMNWAKSWRFTSPGVVRIDAEDLWVALSDILDNTGPGDAVLEMWGESVLEVSPLKDDQPEFHTHNIDVSVAAELPASVPDRGELPSLLTEFTDRSEKWAWDTPPTARAVVRKFGWIDEWLQSESREDVRLRIGLRNEDGSPGEGLLGVSSSDGSDLFVRRGARYGPTEEFHSGTEDIGGIVWPLDKTRSASDDVMAAFDPDRGTVPAGEVGLVADSTYDRDQLWGVSRGSPRTALDQFVLSFGFDSRLRIERGDYDADFYFLYELAPAN